MEKYDKQFRICRLSNQDVQNGVRARVEMTRDLLMVGYDYQEIAELLEVGQRTIKSYACQLFALYGVRRDPRKLAYVQLAVAVYRAGHCNCAQCRDHRHGEIAGLPERTADLCGDSISAPTGVDGG